ncbi:MAG: phosphate acetyltransferase [Streptococcus parasanguinis]|nr:phosphate acetyltransferase [Streptococcus parasanguinis]
MEVFEKLKSSLVGRNARIVLPEGEEPRILQAAKRIVKESDVTPVLLGNTEKIRIYLEIEGVTEGFEVIDPHHYDGFEEMVAALVERRKGKMTEEEARQALLEDVNYFGVMLVYLGLVDGMVSGAIHSTASTVRPALQIIKTQPGVKRTSGAFLMVRGDERYLFADCAININPDAEGLAEIAINSASTAKMFGIDPHISMLSYSTKGSGFGEGVDKVVEATKIAQELRPDLDIDGELQFDAAFVPEIAALKAPGSNVAGKATVFVFPSIEAGNISYKMAERFGGFAAVGPVLQGLNKPVNDLSRGCNADDVFKLTLITASQAKQEA